MLDSAPQGSKCHLGLRQTLHTDLYLAASE